MMLNHGGKEDVKRKHVRKPPIIEPFISMLNGLSYLADHMIYVFTGVYRCEFCYRKFGLEYEMYTVWLPVCSSFTACEECYRKHTG